MSGDFNGDGARDLLVRRNEKTVDLYLYDADRREFSRKANAKIDVSPGIYIVDIDKDGRSDLFRFDEEKNELLVLLAKGGAR